MWFRRSDRQTGPGRPSAMVEMLETRRLMAGVAPADFDGDDVPDILWRNYSNGNNAVWIMGGASNLERERIVFLPASTDTDWQALGTGYFNDDDVIDIVWHHATDGRNAIWYMGGTDSATVDHVRLLDSSVPAQGWQGAGVADINQDGTPDILWRNALDGRNAVWFMGGDEGSERTGVAFLPQSADSTWVIGAIGNFDDQGGLDILWRNIAPGDGRVAVWQMGGADGTERIGVKFLPTSTNVAWFLSGAHDYDTDGDLDLLWRNLSTGDNAAWIMTGDGSVRETVVFLLDALPVDWQIVGAQVL